MVTIMRHLLILLASLGLLLQGCQKPDPEFVHDDPTVTAFYISPVNAVIATTIQGVIDESTGKVTFPIPKKLASYYDPAKLKVRANIGFDIEISPSLMGIHDLSKEQTFTSRATQTGTSKVYTLFAYYSRDME